MCVIGVSKEVKRVVDKKIGKENLICETAVSGKGKTKQSNRTYI